MSRPHRTKKYKKYAVLNQFNNKRIINIASYNGDDENVVATIEKGMIGIIRNCNAIQKDVCLELFSLNDEGRLQVGIMVDDNCPYEDETIKQFFVTQMATISGLFFTEPKASQYISQ